MEIIDPWVDSEETKKVYKIDISNILQTKRNMMQLFVLWLKRILRLKKSEWEEMIHKDDNFDLKGIVQV